MCKEYVKYTGNKHAYLFSEVIEVTYTIAMSNTSEDSERNNQTVYTLHGDVE